MERKLLAAATGIGAAALLAPAAAAQVYAGAGVAIFQSDAGPSVVGPIEDVSLGAVLGRAGFKVNPFFGVEGEFAVGIQDSDFDVIGQQVTVSLDKEYGVFVVGWLPIPLVGDVFARAGYAELTMEVDAGFFGSASEDGAGLAYGAGLQFSQFPFTQLRVEYTRYEHEVGEIDSYGVSALFQF